MPNPFVHAELMTTSVPKARAFYAKLFKWKLQSTTAPTPDGKYTLIDPGPISYGSGGGMMKQCIPDAPSSWMPYVQVDDIKAATKKAKRLGATVCRDVTRCGDMGWLSIIVDPTGAMIGLWQTMNHKVVRKKAKG